MRSILVYGASVIALVALVTAAFVQAACSGDKELVEAADAPIGIETNLGYVTVENRAGTPLLDVKIAIQTPAAPYSYLITRLESGQKREVAVGSFTSRDGAFLNLRLMKPRTVRVNARDLTEKAYEAQVSWK
jgi:hypothetical protein